MELSVVRFEKNSMTAEPSHVHLRAAVVPENYLSQCPFLLLNETSYAPRSEFSVPSRAGVVAVTLVLEGGVKQSDEAGEWLQLSSGDAVFFKGCSSGLARGKASSKGVRLLHMWVDLPTPIKAAEFKRRVVRHQDVLVSTTHDAALSVYCGVLGAVTGPLATPWPFTVADLTIQGAAVTTLALASNERAFIYVLNGHVALGRNQVRLSRGSVAWIERTTGREEINSLTIRATNEARLLLVSSAVHVQAAASGDAPDISRPH